MQLEEFNEKADKAIEELKAAKPKEAMIIHHDDADGLCSAAITKDFGMADGHQYGASVVVPTDKKHVLIENAERAIGTL